MKEKAGKKAVQKRGRGNETIGREEVKEAMKEGRIYRDVVRFLNPGVLGVMWWAKSAPSGWNRVNRTPKFWWCTPTNDSSYIGY